MNSNDDYSTHSNDQSWWPSRNSSEQGDSYSDLHRKKSSESLFFVTPYWNPWTPETDSLEDHGLDFESASASTSPPTTSNHQTSGSRLLPLTSSMTNAQLIDLADAFTKLLGKRTSSRNSLFDDDLNSMLHTISYSKLNQLRPLSQRVHILNLLLRLEFFIDTSDSSSSLFEDS
ncbi:hypothetical protein BCR33DRAFT_711908 [Rhizoclosmatium globosum]|uniref:Uncharacterized protein n=1 Tax=Rhizoclosmatium globosum TaxID=329046 RepID=A0A1Y2D048_9FUNG|nr:hypothetical protein BCR33DRAFT_711908 [Rhizoclosmatium globosum]|eukprot:ORY52648.1 hypothetical protein BCR33DRAFT_711908 [Rhizoclosmatium globosum]